MHREVWIGQIIALTWCSSTLRFLSISVPQIDLTLCCLWNILLSAHAESAIISKLWAWSEDACEVPQKKNYKWLYYKSNVLSAKKVLVSDLKSGPLEVVYNAHGNIFWPKAILKVSKESALNGERLSKRTCVPGSGTGNEGWPEQGETRAPAPHPLHEEKHIWVLYYKQKETN